MIRPEEDDGVVKFSGSFQFLEFFTHPIIHLGDVAVKARDVAANAVGVGVEWRDGHVGGVHPQGMVAPCPNLRFMCYGGVEDRKERLSGCSVLIMCLVTVFVPHRGRGNELIVSFDVVGTIVSLHPKVLRKRLDIGWGNDGIILGHTLNFRIDIERAHVVATNGSLVHARDDGATARSAYPCRGKSVSVPHALPRQPVDIRGGYGAVAVTAEPRAHVFYGQPEDVGRGFLAVKPGVMKHQGGQEKELKD